MFRVIRAYFKRKRLNKLWRLRNSHNTTKRSGNFNINSVIVGNYTYGGINVLDNNPTTDSKLIIGNYCSIASDVVFLLNSEHQIDTISSFPFKVKCLKKQVFEAKTKGNIVVKDDVWIGQRALIMAGVTIGQGAVVAAGAVVTHDVPPYAIVGGVPAKVINYRFSEDIIKKANAIDWSKIDQSFVQNNVELLYTPVSEIKDFSIFPLKETTGD